MRQHPIPRRRLSGFTLVELLVTMTIIAILAYLTVSLGTTSHDAAARARIPTEIKAIEAAIVSYSNDNAGPPAAADITTLATAKNVIVADPADPRYRAASQLLFSALTGRAGFKTVPPANTTNYLPIKRGQVGNADSTATTPGAADASYLKDAFDQPYGYYFNPDGATLSEAADNTNNRGFYDLWSTAKRTTASDADRQAWITNWSGR